jgi:hypothetical protein
LILEENGTSLISNMPLSPFSRVASVFVCENPDPVMPKRSNPANMIRTNILIVDKFCLRVVVKNTV